MLSNSFCVRLYYACYLCCLGIALSAIIFILFRYSVCFNTHWDHGPLLMKKPFAFLSVLANAVNKAVFSVYLCVGVVSKVTQSKFTQGPEGPSEHPKGCSSARGHAELVRPCPCSRCLPVNSKFLNFHCISIYVSVATQQRSHEERSWRHLSQLEGRPPSKRVLTKVPRA